VDIVLEGVYLIGHTSFLPVGQHSRQVARDVRFKDFTRFAGRGHGMNPSLFSNFRTMLALFTALLCLPILTPNAQAGPSAVNTPAFSASLNVTRRSLERCTAVKATSTWTVGTTVSACTTALITAPGSTVLSVNRPAGSVLPRDATLNVTLTCGQTRNTLTFTSRVSRDLPGKALNVDVSGSFRSLTTLEVQGESAAPLVVATNPVWLLEKNRLQGGAVLATEERR